MIAIESLFILAILLYGIRTIWSPRHRKFRQLQKEFYEVNARHKAAAPGSPESWAALERMGEIVAEEKKLLYG